MFTFFSKVCGLYVQLCLSPFKIVSTIQLPSFSLYLELTARKALRLRLKWTWFDISVCEHIKICTELRSAIASEYAVSRWSTEMIFYFIINTIDGIKWTLDDMIVTHLPYSSSHTFFIDAILRFRCSAKHLKSVSLLAGGVVCVFSTSNTDSICKMLVWHEKQKNTADVS